MAEKTPSEQIDDIIKNLSDWRGQTLTNLRRIINQAEPKLVEEVKWKKPSKPEGVPVWFYDGNVCIADTLKNAVRLTFPKGAMVKDPNELFNTCLDSKTIRAIDFFEGIEVDRAALSRLIHEAVKLNR